MTDKVPSRVVMYMRVSPSEPPRQIAEFRWSPKSGVSLVKLDRKRCAVAKEIYRHGVESSQTGRIVSRRDGEEFMRTLLEPTSLTYYGFVDQSDDQADDPHFRA